MKDFNKVKNSKIIIPRSIKQVLEGAEGEEYKSKKPADSEAEKIQEQAI